MARTFTEAEAQKVFARVAEKQRAAGVSGGGAVLLEDLEEAAQAAGLDPSLVAAAAAEIDAPATDAEACSARRPRRSGSRVVRGRVSDEAWEEMVTAARAEFGRTGTAGQIGRTREWTAASGAGNSQAVTRLALEPVGEGTRIVVTRSARDAALGFTFGGAITAVMSVIFGALFAFGVDPELWIPALMLAGISTVLLGGTQIGLRLWHRAQERRAEALLDRLELVARTEAPEARSAAPLAVAPSDVSPSRIDAALLDAEAPADDSMTPELRTRA